MNAICIAPGKRSFSPRPVASDHRRHIARCRAKGCKFAKALDISTLEKPTYYSWLAADGWHKEQTGVVRVTDESALSSALWDVSCPTHGRDRIGSDRVTGSYSEERKCDVRCTSAIGHNCECQCGGANHGSDLL